MGITKWSTNTVKRNKAQQVTMTHFGHKSVTDEHIFALEVAVNDWRLQRM